jgi:hypothetical protein
MGLFKRADPGAMPNPKKVKPDAINRATGRPHSMDAELYAVRDRSVAARNARREAAQNKP